MIEPKHVVEILEACHKFGVAEFTFEGLRISMLPPPTVQALSAEPVDAPPPGPVPTPEEERQRMRDIEAIIKQDQLDILRLSDPLAYEDLIRQNDLELQGGQG